MNYLKKQYKVIMDKVDKNIKKMLIWMIIFKED